MRKDSLSKFHPSKRVIGLVVFTLLLAFAVSPFASPHPDGLERVAEDAGFLEQGAGGFAWSPLPDYEVSIFTSDFLKVGSAGLIGVVIMAAVLYGLGAWLAREKATHARKNSNQPS